MGQSSEGVSERKQLNTALSVCFTSFWCVLLGWDSCWRPRIVQTFVSSGGKAEEVTSSFSHRSLSLSDLDLELEPPSPTPIPGLRGTSDLDDICSFSPSVT